MTAESVARVAIGAPEDVFALRQSGRAAAAAVGRDEADQVRIATALSELGREVVAHGVSATAVFAIAPDGTLTIEIAGFPRAVNGRRGNGATGLGAARKLVDEVIVADAPEPGRMNVTLRVRGTGAEVARRIKELRRLMARSATPGPLDELRLENRDLIATLEQLQHHDEQLARLNAELEETNRGVMAMYAQLADELEETNRGVVALYAELDDKTLRLNEASEAKSRFLASVSHELRGRSIRCWDWRVCCWTQAAIPSRSSSASSWS